MKKLRLTGILIFAGVFVLVIGLQELGIIPNISIPSASSWIFLIFNSIIPAGVMVLSWWLMKVEFGIATTIIFLAYFLYTLFELGVSSGNWVGLFAYPLILAVGCGLLVYFSRKIEMKDYGFWFYGGFLGIIILALITPSIIVTSKYLFVTLIPGLISIPVAFMLINKKGGLPAISAMMISISFPIKLAPSWISWSSVYLEVGGFVVLGIYLAGIYWSNRKESPSTCKLEE